MIGVLHAYLGKQKADFLSAKIRTLARHWGRVQ